MPFLSLLILACACIGYNRWSRSVCCYDCRFGLDGTEHLVWNQGNYWLHQLQVLSCLLYLDILRVLLIGDERVCLHKLPDWNILHIIFVVNNYCNTIDVILVSQTVIYHCVPVSLGHKKSRTFW